MDKDTGDEEDERISQSTVGFHPLIEKPGNKQNGLYRTKKTAQEIVGCKVCWDVLLPGYHGVCLINMQSKIMFWVIGALVSL